MEYQKRSATPSSWGCLQDKTWTWNPREWPRLPSLRIIMKQCSDVSSFLRPPENLTGAASSLSDNFDQIWTRRGGSVQDSRRTRQSSYFARNMVYDVYFIRHKMLFELQVSHQCFQSRMLSMYCTRILAAFPIHSRTPMRPSTCSIFLSCGKWFKKSSVKQERIGWLHFFGNS